MVKMFPTKSIVDYMSEINRHFPRSNESDLYPSPMSGANRSSSSAESTSPESFPELLFSPERRPVSAGLGIVDTPRLQDSTLEQQLFARRQRPIVGRKLLQTTGPKPPMYEKPTKHDQEYSTAKHIDDNMFLQSTPPRIYVEYNHNPQTVLYELFPSENNNRGFEFSQFLTPVKQTRQTSAASFDYMSPSTNISPNMPNMSPNMPHVSPKMTNMTTNMSNMTTNMSNMSPNMRNMTSDMRNMTSDMRNMTSDMTHTSPNMPHVSPNMRNMSPNMTNMSPNMTSNMMDVSPTSYNTSQSQFSLKPNALSYQRSRFESNASSVSSQYWAGTGNQSGASNVHTTDMRQTLCTFCRKNGERPQVFLTHTVKKRMGNKHVVTCPILRSHVCSTCGLSGDDAHTITYCPVLRTTNNGMPLQSATITLKSTRLKSSGRRRY